MDSAEDGFVARRSNHVSGAKFSQSDGDVWQETLAVCEINKKLAIRSYYTSSHTNQRVWDEPPSGASTIKAASDEMRRMAKVQLNEMQIVTGQVEDPADSKKKGGLMGGIFRRKNKQSEAPAAATTEPRTTKDGGEKVHPRIKYKPDSFISEAKRMPKEDGGMLDHAMQEALVASIAESSGHHRPSKDDVRHHHHLGHHPDDDFNLALAMSLMDSQPQEDHKLEDGVSHHVAGSAPHGRERSMHRRERAASPHRGGDRSKSPHRHTAEPSTHRRHHIDADVEKAIALSLAESTKPSGLKDTPATAEGKVAHSLPAPAVGVTTASSFDHHRSEKSAHHRKETAPTHLSTSMHHQRGETSGSDAGRHHKMQRHRSLGDLPHEPQQGELNKQPTLHRDASQEHHRPEKSEHHRLEKSSHHRTERPAVERSTHRRRHVDSDLEKAIALSLAESTKPSGLKDTTVPGEELAAHAAVAGASAVGVSALASLHQDPSEKLPHHGTEKPPSNIVDFSDAGRHHKMQHHRSRGDSPHQGELINQTVPHRPAEERSMHRRRYVDSDLEKALALSLAESSTKPVGLKDPPPPVEETGGHATSAAGTVVPGPTGIDGAAFLQPQEHHRSEKSAHHRRGRPAAERSTHRRRHIDSDLEMALALSLAESTTPTVSRDSPPTAETLGAPATTTAAAVTVVTSSPDLDRLEKSSHHRSEKTPFHGNSKGPHNGEGANVVPTQHRRSRGDRPRIEDEAIAWPLASSLQDTTQGQVEEKKPSTTALTTKKRLKPISAMTEKEQLAFALRASIMDPEPLETSPKEPFRGSGAASDCAQRSTHHSQGVTRGRNRSPQRGEIKEGHSATRSKHACGDESHEQERSAHLRSSQSPTRRRTPSNSKGASEGTSACRPQEGRNRSPSRSINHRSPSPRRTTGPNEGSSHERRSHSSEEGKAPKSIEGSQHSRSRVVHRGAERSCRSTSRNPPTSPHAHHTDGTSTAGSKSRAEMMFEQALEESFRDVGQGPSH
jgi:Ubiquitin interaction motif